MRRKLVVAVTVFSLLAIVSALWADKDADLKTLICKANKVVMPLRAIPS